MSNTATVSRCFYDTRTSNLAAIKRFLDDNIGSRANFVIDETMRGIVKSATAGKVNLGVDDDMLFNIDIGQVVAYSLCHLPVSGGQVTGRGRVFEQFWREHATEEVRIVVRKAYRSCRINNRTDRHVFLGLAPGICLTVPFDRIKDYKLAL